MLPQLLLFASATIIFVLGTVHLVYTFRSDKFMPRDRALVAQMQGIAPVISRDTTMWKAWIGFNASHSLGAMLFGLVYGYLSVSHFPLLRQDVFLWMVGGLFLAGMLLLARRYWFRIPLAGIALATALFATAALLALG